MKINLRHEITQRLHVFFKVLQLLVNHGAKYALDLTFLTINKDKNGPLVNCGTRIQLHSSS